MIFLALGKSPAATLYLYFVEPLTSSSSLSEVAVKAGPLILIGIGLSIGFRAGIWNIGAEGQYITGALFGSSLAVYFHESTNSLILPAMLVLGVLGGMAWAAIPALLKIRFNANEILVKTTWRCNTNKCKIKIHRNYLRSELDRSIASKVGE